MVLELNYKKNVKILPSEARSPLTSGNQGAESTDLRPVLQLLPHAPPVVEFFVYATDSGISLRYRRRKLQNLHDSVLLYGSYILYLTSNDETTNKNSIDEEDFEPAG